jgi:hypothetical protein
MTQPLDLAPIQARTDAATAGPWWNDGHEIYRGEPGDTSRWIGETCNSDNLPASDANGAFLAHVRQDVPALLAEVTRLRAELVDARAGAVHEAARLLEATGHSDDAVNFLDGWADYDQAAPAPEAGPTRDTPEREAELAAVMAKLHTPTDW